MIIQPSIKANPSLEANQVNQANKTNLIERICRIVGGVFDSLKELFSHLFLKKSHLSQR